MLADGTQGELRMPRHADLANDEHIKWSAQGLRHQRCNWDTTPWETQNHGAGGPQRERSIPQPAGDQLGQPAPGIRTVPEHPLSLRPTAMSCWQ